MSRDKSEKRRPTDYFEKLSSRLKSKLGELFLLISDEEKKIEYQRQLLATLSAFDPYSCFTRIDRACTTFVSSADILNFLVECN